MIRKFYNSYLSKDKPLRHYTQHFLVAAGSFLLLHLLFPTLLQWKYILLFLLFSYLPDIDGLLGVVRFRNKNADVRELVNLIKQGHLRQAATKATQSHKQINQMLIHNVFGLMVVIGILMYAVISSNLALISIFGAVLAHFVFDIADDYYQLKHIKNWLWMFIKA